MVQAVEVLLVVAKAWGVCGLLFAAAFLARGARRIDDAVAGSSPGFYVMVLPGTIALWPWLLVRWIRCARTAGVGP